MDDALLSAPLLRLLLGLADDALILGHRLSEWCSRGPFLEEDIALSNTALDYIGRARLYYQYATTLEGNKTEDDLAFLRDERQFCNLLLNELPRGDFAFTMVRQLLVDYYQHYLLQHLVNSTDATLAAIAAKAQKENRYHVRRSTEWVITLGDGTAESRSRMQTALEQLWGFTHEMFAMEESQRVLVEEGITADPATFREQWTRSIGDVLIDATLAIPESQWAVHGGRQGYHTEHLGHLLTEMQFLHRIHPGASW